MSSLACCEPSKRQRTSESSAAGVADLPSPHRPEPANALLPSSFFLCARLRLDLHPVTSCLERTHCGWYRPCKTVKGAMSQRLQVAVYDGSCQVRSSPRACHCLFLLRPSSTRRSSTCESLPSPMSRQVKMQAALYSQDLQRVATQTIAPNGHESLSNCFDRYPRDKIHTPRTKGGWRKLALPTCFEFSLLEGLVCLANVQHHDRPSFDLKSKQHPPPLSKSSDPTLLFPNTY